MKVVVTGSSGLIGSVLVSHLRADGHEVRRLVRRVPRGADEIQWHPSSGYLEPDVVDGVDAVVHLAGAGIGDHRWAPDYKGGNRGSPANRTTPAAAPEPSPAAP